LHGNPHSHRNLAIFHSNEIISCGCCPPEPLSSCCSKPFPGFEEHQTVVVIGAGQTAGHLTLKLLNSNEHTKAVILCRRDEISLRQFDFPLEWMGTKKKCTAGKVLEF